MSASQRGIMNALDSPRTTNIAQHSPVPKFLNRLVVSVVGKVFCKRRADKIVEMCDWIGRRLAACPLSDYNQLKVEQRGKRREALQLSETVSGHCESLRNGNSKE